MERRYLVRASQTISLQTFFARQMMVNNLLPRWLYFRIGGTDVPDAQNADLQVPPMTVQIIPLPATNQITVGVGPAIVVIGQQVTATDAVVTFYDVPTPVGIGSINLNPTRLGQIAQNSFVVAGAYTQAFPCTQVHVSNYSQSWVYVAYGTLVIPTAATANAVIPPMSERSLTCPPTAQFAFGLSAALVTLGQQVPAGVNITATFFEYPTPVTIGTADLQPSKLGQMQQRIFTAAGSYTLAYPCTQIHVSNYSTKWVYVAYGTLVIPTALTASASVPPMSERSLPCVPSTQFAFGLSSATVVAPTSIQASQIVATFYEYPVSMALGAAPLSPSGWWYKERLHLNAAMAHNSILDRDLSNFIWGRYSILPQMLAGGLRFLSVSIWDWSQSAYYAQAANLQFVQNFEQSVTFHAGKPIRITYETNDAGAFTLTDILEAW